MEARKLVFLFSCSLSDSAFKLYFQSAVLYINKHSKVAKGNACFLPSFK